MPPGGSFSDLATRKTDASMATVEVEAVEFRHDFAPEARLIGFVEDEGATAAG